MQYGPDRRNSLTPSRSKLCEPGHTRCFNRAVLTDHDIYLFREGTHSRLYEKLGCQLDVGGEGGQFAVWAPNAREVKTECVLR